MPSKKMKTRVKFSNYFEILILKIKKIILKNNINEYKNI